MDAILKKQIGALMTAIAVLAGCKTDLSEITDAQLLSLLGGKPPFFMGDTEGMPLQITAEMQQCISLLSGQNAEIYQDFPEDLLGVAKTECRQELDGRLKDTDRNGTELVLEDFERTDLAERIFTIAEAQDIAFQDWREAKRAAEQARREQEKREAEIRQAEQDEQRRQEIIADLNTRIREAQGVLAIVRERRAQIIDLCETLYALHNDLRARRDEMSNGQKNRLFVSLTLPVEGSCKIHNARGPFDPEKILPFEIRRLEQSLEALQTFEVPERNIPSYLSLPRPFKPNLEGIEGRINRIEEGISEHKALKSQL